jgi:hypothetical protein
MRLGRCVGCGHACEVGQSCQFCYTTSKVVGEVTAYDSWMRQAQRTYAGEIVRTIAMMNRGDTLSTSDNKWIWTKP